MVFWVFHNRNNINNDWINNNIKNEFKLLDILKYLKDKNIDIIKNIYDKLVLRCTKEYFINLIFVIWIAKYAYYPKIENYNTETLVKIKYDKKITNITNYLKNSPLKHIQYINQYSPMKYTNELTYNFNKYDTNNDKKNNYKIDNEKDSLNNNKNDLLNRIINIEKQYKNIISKNNKLNDTVLKLDTQNNKLNERILKLDTQNNKLNDRVLKLDTQNNKLNERVLKLETENNKLNQRILKLETEEDEKKDELNDDNDDEIKKKKTKMEMDEVIDYSDNEINNEDIDIEKESNNGKKCVICNQFIDKNDTEHLNNCMALNDTSFDNDKNINTDNEFTNDIIMNTNDNDDQLNDSDNNSDDDIINEIKKTKGRVAPFTINNLKNISKINRIRSDQVN